MTMSTIKLEDLEYCGGCPFLDFDKEKSTPSTYIGEGYYVYNCQVYHANLGSYLHHPLRLEKCKEEHKERFVKSDNQGVY